MIEAEYDKLHSRVEAECKRVVEKICVENGWDFISGYYTKFTTVGSREEHDFYDGALKEYRINHKWPFEFKKVYLWAETVHKFPNICFYKGEWIA